MSELQFKKLKDIQETQKVNKWHISTADRWTTFIFVDAGPKGNAAMLTQESNKKDEEIKLIGCGSHCITEKAKNYCHLEKL